MHAALVDLTAQHEAHVLLLDAQEGGDLVDAAVLAREGADLTVSNPIPRSVLDGETTSAEGIQYEVLTGQQDRFGWIPTRRGT